jgi:hypothetical protein
VQSPPDAPARPGPVRFVLLPLDGRLLDRGVPDTISVDEWGQALQLPELLRLARTRRRRAVAFWRADLRGAPVLAWGHAIATRVFSEEELDRLRRFPESSRDELIRFITLTDADELFAPGPAIQAC